MSQLQDLEMVKPLSPAAPELEASRGAREYTRKLLGWCLGWLDVLLPELKVNSLVHGACSVCLYVYTAYTYANICAYTYTSTDMLCLGPRSSSRGFIVQGLQRHWEPSAAAEGSKVERSRESPETNINRTESLQSSYNDPIKLFMEATQHRTR